MRALGPHPAGLAGARTGDGHEGGRRRTRGGSGPPGRPARGARPHDRRARPRADRDPAGGPRPARHRRRDPDGGHRREPERRGGGQSRAVQAGRSAVTGLEWTVAENAAWCDLVCAGEFRPRAWTSPRRTPEYYPDAVTLTPDATAADVLPFV